jgi:hypothetical protein
MSRRQVKLALGLALLGGGLATAAAPPAQRWDLYGDPLPPGAVARMGSARWRGEVYRLALVPGGRQVAASAGSGLVLWDLRTGRRPGRSARCPR